MNANYEKKIIVEQKLMVSSANTAEANCQKIKSMLVYAPSVETATLPSRESVLELPPSVHLTKIWLAQEEQDSL